MRIRRVREELKGCHVVLSRTVSTSVGLVLLIPLAVFVVSCEKTGRYEIMTFFFDGIESSKPEGFENRPFDPNAGLAQAAQAPVWYIHEPVKDCTNCHDTQRQSKSPGQAYLIAPVPKLCYNCHDDRTVSARFVHGPVAVGECLECHDHHKSRVKHLLKKAEPNVCYLCHDASPMFATSATTRTPLRLYRPTRRDSRPHALTAIILT